MLTRSLLHSGTPPFFFLEVSLSPYVRVRTRRREKTRRFKRGFLQFLALTVVLCMAAYLLHLLFSIGSYAPSTTDSQEALKEQLQKYMQSMPKK